MKAIVKQTVLFENIRKIADNFKPFFRYTAISISLNGLKFPNAKLPKRYAKRRSFLAFRYDDACGISSEMLWVMGYGNLFNHFERNIFFAAQKIFTLNQDSISV